MLLPEGRSVISGPPDGQRPTALGRKARHCRLSMTVLGQARSLPAPQLSDAVRRTEEISPEPVYPPLSDAPEKRRGVMFPHPTGKCRWQCEAARDPVPGVSGGIAPFHLSHWRRPTCWWNAVPPLRGGRTLRTGGSLGMPLQTAPHFLGRLSHVL